METKNTTQGKRLSGTAIGLALGATLLTTAAFADTQVRLQSSNTDSAFSEGYALSVEDWSAHTLTARSNKIEGFHNESRTRPQVWISDIGTLLFDDADGDGFHSGFSVTIDVDSEFGDTEVYANIYLEAADEPAILLHKTGRFTVYGSTIGDEYRVDSELRNNYAAKSYDLAIDIHDAWSDRLLDSASSRGFDNLSQLPLESSNLNYADEDNYADHHDDDYAANDGHGGNGDADVVITEYAGLFHPLLLLMLAGGALLRRRLSATNRRKSI